MRSLQLREVKQLAPCHTAGVQVPHQAQLLALLALSSTLPRSNGPCLKDKRDGLLLFLIFYFFIFYFYLFILLGLHPQHTKVPRLGVKSELQLLAYTTSTAVPDPSQVGNLLCNLQPRWNLNSLSRARDRTLVLVATS